MDLTDRYRKLFEQSIVGQAFYDKEGNLLTANQKLRDILKFKGESDPFYYHYTLFELPTFRYLLRKDAVDDLYFCTQTVIYERDVNLVSEIRVHPIYHDNQLQMFTLYIRDITQERELYLQHKRNLQQINRTNRHIKEYETELKYLMENVDMRFFRTSFEKREVYMYKEMSQPEMVLGFNDVIERFMEGGFAQELQNPFELLKEPKSKLCQMHSLFHDSSELEWNFIDSVPYYDENGTLTGTYGVVRNVTKLMEKQELLKQETERASQSGMRKSTFLASMSHEIRTPLNAIVGFSDVLATQDTPEEREHILDVITTNCDMLLRLVNDMLALSSLENGAIYIKPARLNFTKCFADVAASLARRVQNPLVEYIVDK